MNPLSKEEFAIRAVNIIDTMLDTSSVEVERIEFNDEHGFTWTVYKCMLEIHITCRFKYRNGNRGLLKSKWDRSAYIYKNQQGYRSKKIGDWWIQY
jgi:hypothetical protein